MEREINPTMSNVSENTILLRIDVRKIIGIISECLTTFHDIIVLKLSITKQKRSIQVSFTSFQLYTRIRSKKLNKSLQPPRAFMETMKRYQKNNHSDGDGMDLHSFFFLLQQKAATFFSTPHPANSLPPSLPPSQLQNNKNDNNTEFDRQSASKPT